MVARALAAYSAETGQLLTPAVGQFWGDYAPTIGSAQTERSEAGLEPVLNSDGSWTYTLPARTDFAGLTKRRIERRWVVDGRVCTNTRGDVMVFEGEFMGVLGAAGGQDTQWHLIWQCHGPGGSDLVSWRPPPVSLGVRNGVISFEGGEGHPDNGYTALTYHKWSYQLGPWRDNVRHRIRIEVMLGNDPDGWVTCVYDGRVVVERWRPQGYWPWDGGVWTANHPGTIYSQPSDVNGDWVQNRAGLYRGPVGSDPHPTYAQWIRWWPIDVGPAHQPVTPAPPTRKAPGPEPSPA